MTTPNIVSVSTITGNTAYIAPATTSSVATWTYNGTTALTGLTPTTNQIFKIDSIVATNTTTNAATVSVAISNNPTFASGTAYYVAYNISVPANASLIVTDKTTGFYVSENQSVGVTVGTANAIHFVAVFEAIS